MSTTISAVILGIILVTTIRPGDGAEPSASSDQPKKNITTEDTLMDLIRNVFPPNIVEACTVQFQTELIYPGNDDLEQSLWKFTSTKVSFRALQFADDDE